MVKKTVIKDEIEMYGETQGKDACHNCITLDKQVNEIIPKAEVPIDYKHYSVYTDEIGKRVAEEVKLKEIPYVKHCKIAEDNTKKCDTVIGYDAKDWKDIGKKREEEFN